MIWRKKNDTRIKNFFENADLLDIAVFFMVASFAVLIVVVIVFLITLIFALA